MARSGHCKACGATIRPRAKDMSVAAASRLHYWKHHPEIMLGKRANRDWGKRPEKKKAVARKKGR